MSNSNNSSIRPNATLAKVAGWVWISYGVLVGCVSLLMAIVGGWVLFLIVLVVASIFAYIGSQTVRGRAKDTLGNGIGSIAFGLFGLQDAIRKFSALTADGDFAGALGSFFGSLILLVAGAIALIGRTGYKQWRASRQSERPGKL
jgi:hypothetical protein